MSLRKIALYTLAIAVSSFSISAHAAGPGGGSLSKNGVRIGNCTADTLRVKYKLDSLMGEATVSGSYGWEGDSSCTLPYSTVVWLKVSNGSGAFGWVKLNPVVPKANSGLGYNTTGSPSWSGLLCGYSGTSATDCYDADQAKLLWKAGDVVDFQVAW